MSRGGSLVKNTAIIALGKICTQFISFILLPLYTTLLSTDEYGTVDLFNTYISLILPIATLMVEQGAFRFLVLKEDDLNESQIVTSSFAIVSALNALFVIFALLFFQFYENQYKYYLIPMLVSASYLNWCLQLARGFKKLSIYSASSVISAGISIALNVFFIAGLGYGASGMLIATVIGHTSAAVFVFTRLKIYKYIRLSKLSKKASKSMLAYSAPLIPNTLSLWIINSSDRTIVNIFMGATANGILAISHKFPSILQTMYSIFQLSWHEMGTVHWNDKDRDSFFSKMFNNVIQIFSSICIIGIGAIPFIYNVLVRGEGYGEAYFTIPIYMVSVLFNIYIGLLGVVYVATKRTKEIAKTTIFSGVLNIVLHLLLIESIGLYAAAISTLLAYFFAAILRSKDVKKYINIVINRKKILIIIISLVIVTVFYYTDFLLCHLAGMIVALISSILLCKDSLGFVVLAVKKKFHR